MSRRGRWLLIAIAAALLVTLPGLPAAAVEDVQPARVEGETRLETAAAIADLAFSAGVQEAVVASATSYYGALAGSALAGALDAPVILTQPDHTTATTIGALQDLGVQQVTLAGGPTEISATVENELAQLYAVNRVGGADPYATAAELARATAFVGGDRPTTDGLTTVFLASGEDFADALALSGPAHDGGFPLVLTTGGALHPQAATVIDELSPQRVIVAGGPDAISDAVLDDIEARGILTTRLGGITRTETAAIVGDYFVEIGYFQARVALLARGDNFPDALTAGTLSSVEDGPILLSATKDVLSDETGAWLADNCPTVEVLQVVGGVAAVSTPVANDAEALAETCGDAPPSVPTTGQTYQVQPLEALEGEAPTTFDFEVARRYDDQPLTGPVDLVLLPCTGSDVTGTGPDTFADVDDDGNADGFATTDTGQARIAVVNGADIEDTTVLVGVEPGEDGDIDIRLASQAADCTLLVVVDGNGNGELDLDAQGHPVEAYGVGKATWT